MPSKLILTGEPDGGDRTITVEFEHEDGRRNRVGGANYDEHGWAGLAAVREMATSIARESGIGILDQTT